MVSTSVSTAQSWVQLGTLPTTMYTAYFFDANHGVVAGVGAIWKYTNGGWTSPTIPGGTVSYFTSIRQLRRGVLYATSGDSYVWVSSDSGATWQNTTVVSNFATDVYLTKDRELHSTNAGTFARLDSNICLRTNNNGSVPSYSTDGGSTWVSPTGYSLIGGLNCYADTCRKMFFATSKRDPSPVYYSLDSGRSWHPCGPNLTTDILSGADGAVYRQDSLGVWCSLDAGTSWELLGGPTAPNGDRGMFGFGAKGKDIIAMNGGAVWRYSHADTVTPADPITRRDTSENCPITRIPITVRAYTRPFDITISVSGSGTQSLSPKDTSFEIPPGPAQTVWFTVSPTLGQRPSFFYVNTVAGDGCNSFGWIDTFSIFPVPIPITPTNVQIENCTVSRIPIAIQPMAQALKMRVTISADSGWAIEPTDTSIHINAGLAGTLWLTPTEPNLPIGSLVHIHATDTVACAIYSWDTNFAIAVTPVPIPWTRTDSVTINACSVMRIPITLDLATCDSLAVDELSINPENGLLSFESSSGVSLARGRTDTLWLRYAPEGREDVTNYQIRIGSHFVPDGQLLDTVFPLYVASVASPHPHVSAPAALVMNSCIPASFPVYLKAAGCENIRVDSIIFNPSGTLVSGGLAGTDTVLAGRTDTFNYTVEGLYPGPRTLDIYCYCYRMGDEVAFDTMIASSLRVGGASTQPLIAAQTRLAVSNCDTSIVPFVLHAPCDSVTITNMDLTVDKSLYYSVNLPFPRRLAAGEFDSLLLAFPPQGLNLSTEIYARIRGTFGGTTTSFDTTGQTQVTFSCTSDVALESPESAPLTLSGFNATSGELRMVLTKNDAAVSECQAEIVNVLGEVAAKRNLPLPSSENQVQWDLSSLASGEYYLRLACGAYHTTSRFVLVR